MTTTPQRLLRRSLIVTGMLVCAASAQAQNEAMTRYRQEMSVCNTGQSNQDVGTCRTEARNALAESRRNGLTNPAGQMQSNMMMRCSAHEGDDRRACEMRMGTQGSTEGSVAAGGILRQSTVTVPSK